MHTTISRPSAPILAATLDKWTALAWADGVVLSRLAPHDRVIVRTRNSIYELIVLVPQTASVMVRGGAFFPAFTPAHVAGSSMGGGVLKLHGVHTGFHMELMARELPVITTRVRAVSVLSRADAGVM